MRLIVLAAAEAMSPVVLWVATLWTGVTTGSWNVVAHVTVIREAHGSAGRGGRARSPSSASSWSCASVVDVA